MKTYKYISIALVIAVGIMACNKPTQQPEQPSEIVANDTTKQLTPKATTVVSSPDWLKSATIYEVNLRQHTKEGTIKAFETHLPRLKEMGIDILWFMPIHPIGKQNRKGSLGSYYSVADYKAVNPEHGTLDDFKAMVKKAHDLGMKVILDWVPNHTAWDHAWVKAHSDWYTKDPKTGKMVPPVADWTDVIDLNYDNADMRKEMIADMQFWLKEADIDGFRCDVAGFVPTDFWAQVRPELEKVKPVFMLAENEDQPELLHNCFNANYGWWLKDVLKNIADGKTNALTIDTVLANYKKTLPNHAFKMHFVTNHDENSWHNLPKLLGKAEDALTVLAFTFDGMPLMYSGQEAGALTKPLSFFEKDNINWGTYKKQDFYKNLLTLKHNNKALWNGTHGGNLVKISTGGKDDKVFAFYREKDGDRVVSFINLSTTAQIFTPQVGTLVGDYEDVLQKGKTVAVVADKPITLQPWGYLLLSNKK